MILDNTKYKLFYESQGYSFLLEDLIVESYLSWAVVVIGRGNQVKKYIQEETMSILQEKGQLFTEEEIQKSLDIIQKKITYLRKIHTDTTKLNSSTIFEMFKSIEEMLGAYSLFDPLYSESIYEQNPNDKRAKLIEDSKNVIRDDFDFVFFIKNGWLQTLLTQIAESFNIDTNEIHWYRKSELFDLIENKNHLEKQIIDDRKLAYVFERNAEGNISFNQGNEAQKIIEIFERNNTNTDVVILKGSVANGKGIKITGEVCIIHRDYSNHQKLVDDMARMKEGSILVTNMTDPEFMPALSKAKAVVTDIGGLLSYAAISARELGIPCVVGTEQATKILKNGNIIEVDTNNGVVKIIS